MVRVPVRQHRRKISPNQTTSVMRHTRRVKGLELTPEIETPNIDRLIELKKDIKKSQNREKLLKLEFAVGVGLITAVETGVIKIP